MSKHITIVLIAFFILSCNKKGNIKQTFYDNGDIKTKYEYLTRTDTSSYILSIYYKGNKLSQRMVIKDNLLNGTYQSFQKDGDLLEIIHYKNDLKHGVARKYNEAGELNGVNLFINDTAKLQYDYYYHDKLKLEMLKYVYLENETASKHTIGEIVTDSTGAIIDSLTTLYVIKAKDTISISEEYCFKFEFPGEPIDSIDFTIHIGELNASLDLKDTLYSIPFKENFEAKGCVKPPKNGYNLFTGIISFNDKRAASRSIKIEKDHIPFF